MTSCGERDMSRYAAGGSRGAAMPWGSLGSVCGIAGGGGSSREPLLALERLLPSGDCGFGVFPFLCLSLSEIVWPAGLGKRLSLCAGLW